MRISLNFAVLLSFGFINTFVCWTNYFGRNEEIALYRNSSNAYFVLLLDGKMHLAPDLETIVAVGLVPSRALPLSDDGIMAANVSHWRGSSAFSQQQRIVYGEPMQSLKTSGRPDDYDGLMRVFVEKIYILQHPFEIISDIPLGPMINPALVIWHGRMVILAGPVVNGSSHRGFVPISIGFAVLNSTTFQIDEVESRKAFKYAFILVGTEGKDGPNKNLWKFYMEDARMMVLPDNRLLLIYGTGKPLRLCTTKITFQEEKVGMNDGHTPANNLGNNSTLLFEKEVYLNSSSVRIQKQKNWSPFLYGKKSQIFYVYTIQPWRIVQVLEDESLYTMGADDLPIKLPPTTDRQQPAEELYGKSFFRSQIKTVSLSALSKTVHDMGWNDKNFGAPRGGSTAILLSDKKHYLTLFHTRIILKGNVNYSYMMGALAFCAHPPFALYSISNVPMVDKAWYTGPWAAKQLDYVVYPMAILVEEPVRSVNATHGRKSLRGRRLYEDTVLLISMGRQDKYGFVVRVRLLDVLEGMQQIGHCGNSGNTTV